MYQLSLDYSAGISGKKLTKMIQTDLHLHTTYSDGRLSPADLVHLCSSRGLKIIAITDHDSTGGVTEAIETANCLQGLDVIPGIELSADMPGRDIHLLGYFIEHKNPSLQQTLKGLREGRTERARETVRKLSELGIHIRFERVQELSDGGAIGRPHIAQAMVENGYVQYPREAFDKYLGKNGPAYVERDNYSPVTAVDLLVRYGAIPAMAHPIYFMNDTTSDEIVKLKRMLSELKEAGLIGLEVFHADHSPEQVDLMASIADEIGLVPCGGSDYHASGNPDDHEPGSAGPPITTVPTLKSFKENQLHASN